MNAQSKAFDTEAQDKTPIIAKVAAAFGIVCAALPVLTIVLGLIAFPSHTRGTLALAAAVILSFLMIACPFLCFFSILFGIFGARKCRYHNDSPPRKGFAVSVNAIVLGSIILLLWGFVMWMFSSLSI